jgi:class 3 adenylate cyclase
MHSNNFANTGGGTAFMSLSQSRTGPFRVPEVRRRDMGDGVLVYFGYPRAHEDDAERAVRAGLELIQAVSGLKSNAPCRPASALPPGWS